MPFVPGILVLNVHGFFLILHLLEIVVRLTVADIHTPRRQTTGSNQLPLLRTRGTDKVAASSVHLVVHHQIGVRRQTLRYRVLRVALVVVGPSRDVSEVL